MKRPLLNRLGYLLTAAGLVLLCIASYRLWGTNLFASRSQAAAVQTLERRWTAQDRGTDAVPASRLAPGTAFAVISIPRLHVLGRPSVFPVVEGDGLAQLDRGAVGHHRDTAMPGRDGNLVLAGHRNGHGEPFRHLDELQVGDRILIASAAGRHTYVLDGELARAAPSDIGVMDPIPAKTGATRPGRYITLITCTPQFSTRYRMIWWGHLAEAARRQ